MRGLRSRSKRAIAKDPREQRAVFLFAAFAPFLTDRNPYRRGPLVGRGFKSPMRSSSAFFVCFAIRRSAEARRLVRDWFLLL